MGPRVKEDGQALEAEKGKETDSTDSAEGMQPCQHLNFNPERLILDFQSAKLCDNKFVVFKSLSSW